SASCACTLVERRMYLLYMPCLTWRSINTVTVLFILSLTTRPSRVLARFSDVFICSGPCLLFAKRGLDPGHVTTGATDLVRLGRLAASLLHTQIELLALELGELFTQLLGGLLAQVGHLHHSTVRVTNVVLIGNLADARANASRAASSGTPSIS